jgi:hypothetical protein
VLAAAHESRTAPSSLIGGVCPVALAATVTPHLPRDRAVAATDRRGDRPKAVPANEDGWSWVDEFLTVAKVGVLVRIVSPAAILRRDPTPAWGCLSRLMRQRGSSVCREWPGACLCSRFCQHTVEETRCLEHAPNASPAWQSGSQGPRMLEPRSSITSVDLNVDVVAFGPLLGFVSPEASRSSRDLSTAEVAVCG